MDDFTAFVRGLLGCSACIVCLVVGFWGLLRKPNGYTRTTDDTVERAYIIRRKSDGYPVEVNAEQLKQARKTGDYVVEGRRDCGGYYATGTTYNGKTIDNHYVPKGYRVKEGTKTKDRRLGV